MTKGLIPTADVDGQRWSPTVVLAAMARAEEIHDAIGTLPDIGATRAAQLLAERFGVPVAAEAMTELDRIGHIERTGSYKGHTLYDGLTLEHFIDRAALDRARHNGRLLEHHAADRHLSIRDSDFTPLTRGNWPRPATHVHSRWQPRRSAPAMPLFASATLKCSWPTLRSQ
ncbi:hypothetical protein [Streptomyces sp. NPDC026092]|uniref:hypothetical protein n=1 Tax=Streptomyces sp. NPDC026092 TaxID=3154797 RepID=UPI0033C63D5F